MVRLNLLLPAMILIVGLPAAGAYAYYRATHDASLRPLGITQQDLAARPGSAGIQAIAIQIDWGQAADPSLSRQEVQRLLSRSFAGFGADHHFRLYETTGDEVRITYIVGPNRFGPFRPSEAARGVRAAVTALRLAQRSPSGP